MLNIIVKTLKCAVFSYQTLHFVYFVGYSSDSMTNDVVRQKRNELFSQEKARQLALVSRLEKIEVRHVGPPEDCVLLMNKGLSTPFNCAMRECVTELYAFCFVILCICMMNWINCVRYAIVLLICGSVWWQTFRSWWWRDQFWHWWMVSHGTCTNHLLMTVSCDSFISKMMTRHSVTRLIHFYMFILFCTVWIVINYVVIVLPS